MNIALIGPSGVGKGTHAAKLVEKFDLLHIVTGELFRDHLENRRALGILAKKYIARGELVPDEMVDAMIEEWLWQADPAKGVLFDGFPRTIYQAKFLDALFEELDRTLEAAIYLRVSDEVVMRRLQGRIICRNCQAPFHLKFNPPARKRICDVCGGELYQRPDDIPEMVRVRLRTFHRVTWPLLDYYQQSGRLIVIDGEAEIDTVQANLIEAVEAIQAHKTPAGSAAEVASIRSAELAAITGEQITDSSFNLVLVGGPGSGKGTQADHLKRELALPHIATGDLFREHLKQETDLGRLAKSYMDRGQLVPDDVTEAMVEERLARPDTAVGFILDGFPRTLPQAEALTQIMGAVQRRLNGVLYIKVSDAEIVSRLSGRLICSDCQTPFHLKFNPPAQEGVCDVCGGKLYQRDDDRPETVRARLETYHRQTAPLINYYREAGLLAEIDGEGSLEEVKERMLSVTHSLIQREK